MSHTNPDVKITGYGEALLLRCKWLRALMTPLVASMEGRVGVVWISVRLSWNRNSFSAATTLTPTRGAGGRGKKVAPTPTHPINRRDPSANRRVGGVRPRGCHHFTSVDRQQKLVMQVMRRWVAKTGEANWIVTAAPPCHTVLPLRWLPSRPLITRMNEINLSVQRGGRQWGGGIFRYSSTWSFCGGFCAAGLKTVYEVDPTDRGDPCKRVVFLNELTAAFLFQTRF